MTRCLERLGREHADYLRDTTACGDAASWVAHAAGVPAPRAVGSAALVWKHVPPPLRNPHGHEVYLLGVLVDPEWRLRGIARALVRAAIELARS